MRVIFLLGLMVCVAQAENNVLIQLLAKVRIGNCEGDCPCDDSANELSAEQAKLDALETEADNLQDDINQAQTADSSVNDAQGAVNDLKQELNSSSSVPGRYRRGTNTVNFTSCEDSTQSLQGEVGNITSIVLNGILNAVQTVSSSYEVTKLDCYTELAKKLTEGLDSGALNAPSNAAALLTLANDVTSKTSQAKNALENAIASLKAALEKKKAEIEAQKDVVENLGGAVPGLSFPSNPTSRSSQTISLSSDTSSTPAESSLTGHLITNNSTSRTYWSSFSSSKNIQSDTSEISTERIPVSPSLSTNESGKPTLPGHSSFVTPDYQKIDNIPPLLPIITSAVTNQTDELTSANPSPSLVTSTAADPPDRQETPLSSTGQTIVPVPYGSSTTAGLTSGRSNEPDLSITVLSLTGTGDPPVSGQLSAEASFAAETTLVFPPTTQNVLQPGWTLMFLIDTQHVQFTPEIYSACITAIWDAIILRKDQNLSVSVMRDELTYTNVDPDEQDICQIYRQLETLSMAFPMLSLPYKQPHMTNSILYIITGNQSANAYSSWSYLQSDFNAICYVLVDNTSTSFYHHLAINTSEGPCVIHLSQMPYHLLDTEEHHPKSRPQCKTVGDMCLTNEECGSIAMVCQDGECIHPECGNQEDNLKGNNSSATPIAPTGCCPPYQFLCHELPLRCIPRVALCDTRFDCLTGEDEHPLICEKYECPNAHLKCSSYQCIQPQHKCDGIHQCLDGSDEEGCQI